MMFRTLLFIPGNNKRFLEKSKLLYPDILCFDLEDSVPIAEKSIARDMLIESFSSSKRSNNHFDINNTNKNNTTYKNKKKSAQLFVRINSFESELYEQDLESVICERLDGIVIPKVNSASELEKITEIIANLEKKRNIEKTIKLIPSIESSQGVVNAYNIAKFNSRICSLVFGVFDYLYDMKLDYENEGLEYSYARAKIPVDARAAGIPALDSIWQNVDDLDGLQRDAKIAKRLGYAGKSIIHPKHIEPVHNVFVPSQNEIEWAKKVVSRLNLIQEQGDKRGAFKIDGRMIDAVHFKQAKLILDFIAKDEKL
ncbi:MAG TPA: CoA ester lyase [Nitrososphaeraceae archaeon]|nr:CoA ester lyase [Nitrososphaeraceae archaeon]